MRIGLVSYRCENNNVPFNLRQIERALREAKGRADLLCFGEAFLQGFDSLRWDYKADRETAVAADSPVMEQLKAWTREYGVALLFGYIERDGESLYSACAVLDAGALVHNYRRISKGWKEFRRTDAHYKEGHEVRDFWLRGVKIRLALCGDMWDYPERFRTDALLIWPVYVNFNVEQWEGEELAAYAAQASLAADRALMVNPLDSDPENHGGAFDFQRGRIAARLPFDREDILILDVAE